MEVVYAKVPSAKGQNIQVCLRTFSEMFTLSQESAMLYKVNVLRIQEKISQIDNNFTKIF